MRLHELHIQNFKFFPKHDPKSPLLEIGGKNLLIYGENGSGKSTIYWAIYTLLESAFKVNEFEVEKYFKKGGDYGLVNIHATKTKPPYIKMVLKDDAGNNPKVYEVNPNLPQIVANMKDSSIRESGMASDFINYRVLFRLHHVKHSKDNDLFGWFEDEIFPYIIIDRISRVNSLGDVYREIKQGPKKVKDFEEPDTEVYPNPAMRLHPEEAVKKDYKKYQTYERKLKKFNRKFKSYLRDRVARANEILQNDFGQNFEIKLDYEPARASITADELNWQDPKVILKIPRYEGRRNVVKRAHSFLNEAKWTSIGLSIRFAILEDWTNRPSTAELKLLTIDDMLLSLDMINRDVVLNLLLNRYSADYQLLMMTHDRYFFELAKGKINASGSSNNWIKLEMYLDEKSNNKYPLLLKSKTNLEKAKSFFKQKEFPASANYMRKATESFVYEFVPKNKQYDRSFNSLNLSQLINKSRVLARTRGWPRTIISDLDQMRTNIFNPGSHYDVYTPVFQNELKKAIETLEQVSTLSGIKL